MLRLNAATKQKPWLRGAGLCAALFLTACDNEIEQATPAVEAQVDAGCSAPPSAQLPRPDRREQLACEVAIVGGGAAGLHTAYRLAPELGASICLFEKEDRLGGRIYDVAKDGSASGPFIGAGARRVMEGQELVFALAEELGIEFEAVPFQSDLMSARGHFARTSDALNVAAYPLLEDTVDTEVLLYDKLRERQNLGHYADFRSYARATLGAEGFQFLADAFRFRGDFSYPLDARGYLDYLDEEWDVCCTASYPKGGMSEFIRRMEKTSTDAGVRIFKSQPVASIERAGEGYRVITPGYVAEAAQLVIGVDPEGFKHIGGEIAESIQSQPEFQALVGVKVAVINQWWPSAWWQTALAGGPVERAWTTEHCINFIEVPVDSYGVAQKVTRSVYSDDISCVAFWEELAKQNDIVAIEAEIQRGLRHLFPEAEIPKPEKTHVQIWPAGWYWLRAGTSFTNADIATWAIEPLAGERISMVGESYNPQRSGWSDGAYKSSIATLHARFGLELEGAAATPGGAKRAARGGLARTRRAQGGH